MKRALKLGLLTFMVLCLNGCKDSTSIIISDYCLKYTPIPNWTHNYEGSREGIDFQNAVWVDECDTLHQFDSANSVKDRG